MSYFFSPDCNGAFEFVFSFLFLQRLKEALAGILKTETEEKLVVKSWISSCSKNKRVKINFLTLKYTIFYCFAFVIKS
jgi:hypothetical protein